MATYLNFKFLNFLDRCYLFESRITNAFVTFFDCASLFPNLTWGPFINWACKFENYDQKYNPILPYELSPCIYKRAVHEQSLMTFPVIILGSFYKVL